MGKSRPRVVLTLTGLLEGTQARRVWEESSEIMKGGLWQVLPEAWAVTRV